jgi:hypothetical protein
LTTGCPSPRGRTTSSAWATGLTKSGLCSQFVFISGFIFSGF